MENEIFEASYLYYICNSKAVKICPNQYADLLRFLYTEDSLKIKKSLELVSRPHFSWDFLIKKNYFVMLHKLANFITRMCLRPKFFNKMCFVFHAQAFDDAWHLNIWKVKIWLSQEQRELLRWNKTHFSLSHNCSLLDMQNKLAKM